MQSQDHLTTSLPCGIRLLDLAGYEISCMIVEAVPENEISWSVIWFKLPQQLSSQAIAPSAIGRVHDHRPAKQCSSVPPTEPS
jgi:hypothetical protein